MSVQACGTYVTAKIATSQCWSMRSLVARFCVLLVHSVGLATRHAGSAEYARGPSGGQRIRPDYTDDSTLTASDGQATLTIDVKEARRIVTRLAVLAHQSIGMKVLPQPWPTLLIIHKVNDRKAHALDCIHFALVVPLSHIFSHCMGNLA